MAEALVVDVCISQEAKDRATQVKTGAIRWNDVSLTFERWSGTEWSAVGGGGGGGSSASNVLQYDKAVKAASAITASNLIAGTASGYANLNSGTAFNVAYPILYANSAITSLGTGTDNYLSTAFTVTATQSLSMTAYSQVFVKGTLSGTTFTPVSTSPLTQTVPTSADGYHYLALGIANSASEMFLFPEHPVFRYVNGKFALSADAAYSVAEAAQTTANNAASTASTAQTTASNAASAASAAQTAASNAASAASTAQSTADGKAPIAHASTATTYGAGTSSNYGHVKLSDSTSTTSGASSGIAATPTAVKAAYDLASTANSAASTAQSTADGKAPTSHASTATTYGAGTSSYYGHVMLSDSTSTTSGASSGIAATPTAVKAAYDLANGKAPTSHASSSTTYGIGTSSYYGHVMLSDSVSSSSTASSGIAASPYAVSTAYNLANARATTALSNLTPTGIAACGAYSCPKAIYSTFTAPSKDVISSTANYIAPVNGFFNFVIEGGSPAVLMRALIVVCSSSALSTEVYRIEGCGNWVGLMAPAKAGYRALMYWTIYSGASSASVFACQFISIQGS